MKEYHKIQTVFNRNPDTKFRTVIEGSWALPEFEYLQSNKWTWTEKVDGTNVRVAWLKTPTGRELKLGGKIHAAQLYSGLVNALNAKFTEEAFSKVFVPYSPHPGAPLQEFDADVTLFGEGYGAKIQKGGGNYLPDRQDFVLFDVRVGEVWLERENVHSIASKFNIMCVPVVGNGSLLEMVEFVKSKPKSIWGDFGAEGVVARPQVELIDRLRNRVITKLKVRDFEL